MTDKEAWESVGAELSKLIADVRAKEHERGEAERALLAASLKQADRKLAELVREVREWVESTDEEPRGKHWAHLDRLLCKYDPKPEGGT
jgi:hypothetical protein